MEIVTNYDYQATSVVDTSDDVRKVDAHLKLWAGRGWELVSGCATGSDITRTKFVMYWRKPINPSSQPAIT
jgi:hypothetical protein